MSYMEIVKPGQSLKGHLDEEWRRHYFRALRAIYDLEHIDRIVEVQPPPPKEFKSARCLALATQGTHARQFLVRPHDAPDSDGFKCFYCEEVRPDRKSRSAHMRVSHSWEHPDRRVILENKCPLCGLTYTTIRAACDHFQHRRCLQINYRARCPAWVAGLQCTETQKRHQGKPMQKYHP